MNKNFLSSKEEVEAKTGVTNVIQKEASEIGLKTVAKTKARLEAYEIVYGCYEAFIKDQAEKLSKGDFKSLPYKEMSVSRLIAHWLIRTEEFLEDSHGRLRDAEKTTRKGFIEESLHNLPDDLKEGLVAKIDTKKQELLEWLAKELRLTQKIANERNK